MLEACAFLLIGYLIYFCLIIGVVHLGDILFKDDEWENREISTEHYRQLFEFAKKYKDLKQWLSKELKEKQIFTGKDYDYLMRKIENKKALLDKGLIKNQIVRAGI